MRALKHSSSLEGKVACSNVSVMVVFIAELETREQCGQSNITMAGRHQILVSDCISGKRPFFLLLHFTTTKPHHCSAYSGMYSLEHLRILSGV